MNKLIINADDFGMDEACSKAIYACFCSGLITDTTMVANGEAFDLGVDIINSDDKFRKNIGVHLNLTEGIPLTEAIANSKFITNGRFNQYFKNNKNNFVPLTKRELKVIHMELCAQIEKIQSAGVKITHIDSHHHIHTNYCLAKEIVNLSKLFGICKIRIRKNVKKLSIPKKAMYGLYNQYLALNGRKTVDWFGNIYEFISVKEGISEIMVHPDYDSKGHLIDRDIKQVMDDTILKSGRDYVSEYDKYVSGQGWELASYQTVLNK